MATFHDSPNVLFDVTVAGARRLSPRFVRLTLSGPSLQHVTPRGLDQRVKILLPGDDDYPAELAVDLLPEAQWRQAWRACPDSERPALRSYTISASRPTQREVDLDFYLHDPAGPASLWARQARPGDRLLLSAPDARRDTALHGVQWRPGTARHLLLAGDETAYPALRGIVAGLADHHETTVVVEAGDPADADWLRAEVEPHAEFVVRRRGTAAGGRPLAAALAGWLEREGPQAAAADTDFHAWFATESRQVAEIRASFEAAGIAAERRHGQGYWNDRPRAQASVGS